MNDGPVRLRTGAFEYRSLSGLSLLRPPDAGQRHRLVELVRNNLMAVGERDELQVEGFNLPLVLGALRFRRLNLAEYLGRGLEPPPIRFEPEGLDLLFAVVHLHRLTSASARLLRQVLVHLVAADRCTGADTGANDER